MNNSVLFFVGLFLVIVAGILWTTDTNRAVVSILAIVGIIAAVAGAVLHLKYRTKT
jgi:hypothetical protein